MSGWVRLWHDMPTDPKWRAISRKSGASISEVIAIFNFLMVNASANASERGRTNHVCTDDIAAALDVEETLVEAVLQAMNGKVIDGDGFLTGWGKRQPKREDNSAARAKDWREKRKANALRTQANAEERPEVDTEIDSDVIASNEACPTSVEAGRVIELFQPEEVPSNVLTPEHVRDEWNLIADKLGKPKIRALTPERRQAVKARIKGYSLDDWFAVMGAIERSPFLRGDTGWHGCTFDWVMKKGNFQKILEGNYDDKPVSQSRRY